MAPLLLQSLQRYAAIWQECHQGGGGGCGSVVGHQVSNGCVVFMANAANYGHRTGGQTACQLFVVKHRQVLTATAAAADHERIDSQSLHLLAYLHQGAADGSLYGTLHWYGHDEYGRRRPALGAGAQHVG